MKHTIYAAAIIAVVALSACASSANTEPADPERAAECEALIQEGDDDPVGCRTEGYDPVWNALSIYATDEDYAAYRRDGTVPSCDDIVGRKNPMSELSDDVDREYGEAEARSCEDAIAADSDDEAEQPEFSTAIADAAAECGVSDNVADEGRSISFDTQGSDDRRGDSFSDVSCVLTELDTPDYVIQRMDSTRALDGTLDESWGDYAAFWNYHPDSGMNLTVHA